MTDIIGVNSPLRPQFLFPTPQLMDSAIHKSGVVSFAQISVHSRSPAVAFPFSTSLTFRPNGLSPQLSHQKELETVVY
jgi:hypothetical protein